MFLRRLLFLSLCLSGAVGARVIASSSLEFLGVAGAVAPRRGHCVFDCASLTGALFISVPIGAGVHVLGGESVSAHTMRFPRVLCQRTHAAKHIDTPSNRLQVTGVDAGGISTEVIELESFWHWPDENRVGRDVCKPHARSPRVESRHDFSVAFVTKARPVPAHRGIRHRRDLRDALSKVHRLHETNIAAPRWAKAG